jgi:hypothetical protein
MPKTEEFLIGRLETLRNDLMAKAVEFDATRQKTEMGPGRSDR